MNSRYGEPLVEELRKNADSIKDRIWIAVPFIGSLKSVRKIIGRKWIDNPNLSIRLLTDISEVNNINSETIRTFFSRGSVKHLEGLHAKIFITDGKCLITSANLTFTAFAKRHEIGIFLDNEEGQAPTAIFETWWKKAKKVTAKQLKPILRRHGPTEEDEKGKVLPKLWKLPDEEREVTYWLKPIGATDDPITEKRRFGHPTEELHFASPKRIPKVQIGDILIAYGVGAKRVLSVYQATSLPMKVTKAQIKARPRLKRWPWYVMGKNLTPEFGKKWPKHSLYTNDLIAKYLRRNPNSNVTTSGGNDLNALMFGKDKIKLEAEFARFVIQKIGKVQMK